MTAPTPDIQQTHGSSSVLQPPFAPLDLQPPPASSSTQGFEESEYSSFDPFALLDRPDELRRMALGEPDDKDADEFHEADVTIRPPSPMRQYSHPSMINQGEQHRGALLPGSTYLRGLPLTLNSDVPQSGASHCPPTATADGSILGPLDTMPSNSTWSSTPLPTGNQPGSTSSYPINTPELHRRLSTTTHTVRLYIDLLVGHRIDVLSGFCASNQSRWSATKLSYANTYGAS
jgi:hypothetical protein